MLSCESRSSLVEGSVAALAAAAAETTEATDAADCRGAAEEGGAAK